MEQQVSAVLITGHGVGSTAARLHERRVAKVFSDADIIALPQFGRLSISESADITEEVIKQRYRGARLVLVGHSMGGLVAAELALRLGDQVLRVVAISTPFGGTPWAFIPERLLPSHRDMRRGSEYLDELSDRMSALRHKLDTFAFSDDGMVSWFSTYVPGADRNYLVGNPQQHERALAMGYEITPVQSVGRLSGGHFWGPLNLNGQVAELLAVTWERCQAEYAALQLQV